MILLIRMSAAKQTNKQKKQKRIKYFSWYKLFIQMKFNCNDNEKYVNVFQFISFISSYFISFLTSFDRLGMDTWEESKK